MSIAALVVLGSIGIALRESAFASRLTRLADLELVRGLQAEAREFWPAAPQRLEPMDAWLSRAQELLARRIDHRRAFDELTLRALPYSSSDRARDHAATHEDLTTLAHELDGLAAFVARGDRSAPPTPPDPEELRAREAATRTVQGEHPEALVETLRDRVAMLRVAMQRDVLRWRPDIVQLDDFERLLGRAAISLRERATYRFEDSLDAWRHDALHRLLEDLDRLAALSERVRAQREQTVELARLYVGEGASTWERARAAIAASPRYHGLAIQPIFGMVPLGENSTTHLWEFLFAESGVAPAPDESTSGRTRMDEATGLVFVLLPGGRFFMGQRENEGPPIQSALPVHEVELAPFFISKFEVSVAQAERLGGFPSEKTRPEDGRLPLALDWERSRAMFLQHGLELPTEAQWEYAARADANEPAPLDGHANVFDVARITAIHSEGTHQNGEIAGFDDGFAGPAPIGSFRPNGFGLHDVLGNVSEWCLDHYVSRGYSTLVPRAGDGLRATVVSAQLRAMRGGSFSDGPDICQPARRLNDAPNRLSYSIGVRPVRSISPD